MIGKLYLCPFQNLYICHLRFKIQEVSNQFVLRLVFPNEINTAVKTNARLIIIYTIAVKVITRNDQFNTFVCIMTISFFFLFLQFLAPFQESSTKYMKICNTFGKNIINILLVFLSFLFLGMREWLIAYDVIVFLFFIYLCVHILDLLLLKMV